LHRRPDAATILVRPGHASSVTRPGRRCSFSAKSLRGARESGGVH
jgi:hypothetical protein